MSRERKGHPDYAAVWKGHKTATPGGLHKEDIIRKAIKGPAKGPPRYRYISRARHLAAKERMRSEGGLPDGFAEHKIAKRWRKASGSRKRKS